MLDGIHFKTIWGSLVHCFLSGNRLHMFWAGGIVLIMIVLAVLHRKWKFDYGKKMIIWRCLCLLPLIAAGAHYMLYLKGLPFSDAMAFIPLYAPAVFALLPVPFASKDKGFGFSAFLTGLLCFVSVGYFF